MTFMIRSSSESGQIGSPLIRPALLWTMSSPPKVDSAAANIVRTSCGNATSTFTNAAAPPRSSSMRRTVSVPPMSSRSATITVAPSAARATALARPIPVPPPVTRATFPAMSMTRFLTGREEGSDPDAGTLWGWGRRRRSRRRIRRAPVAAPANRSAPTRPGPAAPWWHSPWRLLALGAAVLFLGLAAGYAFFGGDSERSSGSTVDVGFLQDMRAHHDQAVSMAFTYLEKPAGEQDPVLRSIAKTILAEQQFENGYMVGLLLDMGADPANETGQAMAWMDQPVPLERMPGMATEAQMDELQAATGPEADALFVELMTAHHEGGIHMAEFAAEQGSRRDVRSLAERMAANQRGEIVDLRDALARAQA